MRFMEFRRMFRHLASAVATGGILLLGSMQIAIGSGDGVPAPESGLPGPVALAVTGASAGITTDYFEEVLAEALVAGHIFSAIDNSGKDEVVMPMIRSESVLPVFEYDDDTPYLLQVRVIRVDTPSFSLRMHVGMTAIWTLYRTADKAELMHEKIHSTYTGGYFEGGISGANRVRVALEGAARENIRTGLAMLESLDFDLPENREAGQDEENAVQAKQELLPGES